MAKGGLEEGGKSPCKDQKLPYFNGTKVLNFIPWSCSPKWHLPKSLGKGVKSLGIYINDLRWALNTL